MAITGTLEDALGKVYMLYMENKVSDQSTCRYLCYLEFSKEEAYKLLDHLRKDKREL